MQKSVNCGKSNWLIRAAGRKTCWEKKSTLAFFLLHSTVCVKLTQWDAAFLFQVWRLDSFWKRRQNLKNQIVSKSNLMQKKYIQSWIHPNSGVKVVLNEKKQLKFATNQPNHLLTYSLFPLPLLVLVKFNVEFQEKRNRKNGSSLQLPLFLLHLSPSSLFIKYSRLGLPQSPYSKATLRFLHIFAQTQKREDFCRT